ncbi:MAG: hypothetical protein RQ847_12515 [Wenzhouxiangellaceae bacterium]|nr:hypothetical protein [Wenzhouxiangellaceae bacterium]
MSLPQLPLSLVPPRRMRFENFVAGANGALVAMLRHGMNEGDWIYLSGPSGSGKSHLAHALNAEWAGRGRRVAFIPCTDPNARALLAGVRAGADSGAIVEDVECLAGQADAERALFNALNQWRAARSQVLLTGSGADGFALPDLVSRISQTARLTLQPLDDAGLEELIGRLVDDYRVVPGRGLAEYLLRHGPRAAGRLTGLFERMSRRAHAERRVVSVPLARECLEELRAGRLPGQ